jgi:hypothetical protein
MVIDSPPPPDKRAARPERLPAVLPLTLGDARGRGEAVWSLRVAGGESEGAP